MPTALAWSATATSHGLLAVGYASGRSAALADSLHAIPRPSAPDSAYACTLHVNERVGLVALFDVFTSSPLLTSTFPVCPSAAAEQQQQQETNAESTWNAEAPEAACVRSLVYPVRTLYAHSSAVTGVAFDPASGRSILCTCGAPVI